MSAAKLTWILKNTQDLVFGSSTANVASLWDERSTEFKEGQGWISPSDTPVAAVDWRFKNL